MIKKNNQFTKILQWTLIVGGIVGIIASFVLTMDKMHLLKDPSYSPNCNINPVLSCGSIIATDQAEVFGFPNPVIGLISFGALLAAGMGMLAGGKYKDWYYKCITLGAALGAVFVHWLIYQSIYSIGALCIYCMSVWSISMPILWYSLLYNLNNGIINLPKKYDKLIAFITKHHIDILVAWYVIVIALIIQNFWYYWRTII